MYDALRSHYRHAFQLLDVGDDDLYELNVHSTATQLLSVYLFGDASLTDDERLIR